MGILLSDYGESELGLALVCFQIATRQRLKLTSGSGRPSERAPSLTVTLNL
jgi:hypothetical protein